jgi:hypothetical protein
MLSGLVNNGQRLSHLGYWCHAPKISINRSGRHVALSPLIEPYMMLLWGVDAQLQSLAYQWLAVMTEWSTTFSKQSQGGASRMMKDFRAPEVRR